MNIEYNQSIMVKKHKELAADNVRVDAQVDYYSDEQVAEWNRHDRLTESDRQQIIGACRGKAGRIIGARQAPGEGS